jgi:hypothetical protein
MTGFSIKLGKNYAMDLCVFYQYRSFKDGLTVINADVNFSWFKGDHNPQFFVRFALFNHTVFDFTIYNIHHFEESE